MAHIVGIPIIKGNSHSIVSCRFTGDISQVFEGAAVKQVGGVQERQVQLLSEAGSGAFCGFIFDINRKSKRASLLRTCDLVALPVADKSAVAGGQAVKVSATTNMIDASGSITITGEISSVDADFAGLDGKTGEAVKLPDGTELECVAVALTQVQVMPAGSGGAGVTSVNGQSGDVSLDAADVGALPDTYTPDVQEAPEDGKSYSRKDGAWSENV